MKSIIVLKIKKNVKQNCNGSYINKVSVLLEDANIILTILQMECINNDCNDTIQMGYMLLYKR